VLDSNFNAKGDFIGQVVDFNGRYSKIEFLGKTKGAPLRQSRGKIAGLSR
jgi:hypothetical protein